MTQQKRRTISKKNTVVKKEKEERQRESMPASTLKAITAIALIGFTILLALALYATNLSDVEGTIHSMGLDGSSSTGPLGFYIKWIFTGLFGRIAYIVPVLCGAAGIYLIKNHKFENSKPYIYISGMVFILCLSSFFYIFEYASVDPKFNLKDFWYFGNLGMGGGILGSLLGYPLLKLAFRTGAFIIILTIALISFVCMTDFILTKAIATAVREYKKRVQTAKETKAETVVPETPDTDVSSRRKRKILSAAEDICPDDSEPYVNLMEAVEELPRTIDGDAKVNIFTDKEAKIPAPEKEPEEALPEDVEIVKPKQRLEGEIPVEISEKVSRENVTIPYVFPETDLLNVVKPSEDDSSPASLREQSAKLVKTLASFNIDVKVLEISKGPAITRFELQPTAGVRVSKITSLADDIALSLAATTVRIEAPIPGKAAIGIELPNSSVSMVTVRDVLESKEFKESPSRLSCALGRDIAGKCIVGDIAKMPHVLIAGATGSGKSVCINSLIASILYKASPNDVKIIMIDPKVVELSVYNGIPHLLIPVVTDPRKAAGALNWAVQEMTTRYKFFADNGVRDLKGYNALMERQGMPKLPQIVIIIDELADLMMVAPKDVESYVCRLAQLARAAGMHLVIATQRPSVDVITGVIKANIPSRIAFAVSSYVDSRTILDTGGAEKLLGRGDMLFYPMGASKPTRVQGAFISDEEVEKLVEFVKQTSEALYDEDILDKIENAGENREEGEEERETDIDPLLSKAIEIVVDSGQASVSLVQRKLSVGYSRAGRLIDQMETRGIIGPHEGSKPRRVLVTKAEYLAMLQASEVKAQSDEPEDDIILPAEPDILPTEAYDEEAYDDADDIIMPPSGN